MNTKSFQIMRTSEFSTPPPRTDHQGLSPADPISLRLRRTFSHVTTAFKLYTNIENFQFKTENPINIGTRRTRRSNSFLFFQRTSILLLTFLVICFAPPALPQDCPADSGTWKAWRDRAIEVAFSQTTSRQNREFIDYQMFLPIAAQIRQIGINCLGLKNNVITTPPELDDMLGNFFSFFGALGIESDDEHRFGMTIPDRQYLDEIRSEIELPSLLKSQAFLQAISNRKTYKKAFDMITEQNRLLPKRDQWIPLIYESRFLTTPDTSNTYGRFFVLVPGEIDKWIQFGILTPGMPEIPVNNLSIVAVHKLPQHTPKSPNTETFIIDYWRTYNEVSDRNGVRTEVSIQTKFHAEKGTENCSECHKTPIVGIHPQSVYQFSSTGELIPVHGSEAGSIPNLLNSLIEGYGPPNFRGWQPHQHYGPPLGDLKVQRTDNFLRECTQGTRVDASSFQRLRDSMNCASCHDDNLLGRINFPQATYTSREFALQNPTNGALSLLVDTYILQRWMPPGTQLTDDELKALSSCLKQEYLNLDTTTGTLIDWLKGKE